MERLQRVMAARGAGSRRHAETLIKAGRVSVGGKVVSELGTKVDPRSNEIRVDGQLLRVQPPRYIVLNKPRGYITTVNDERDRRTVMDLVDLPERVYPVGRLDRQTEGLLLLTNDGDVANRIMHPRYRLAKEYNVLTLSRPSPQTLQRLRDGVVVDGKRVIPDDCRILRETHDGLILKVVIHEGMYHIVRRMMDEVGIPVTRLRRVRLGPLTVQNLAVGEWRDLTAGELNNLLQALHLDRDSGEQPRGWRTRRFDPKPPSGPEDAKPTPPATTPNTRKRHNGQRSGSTHRRIERRDSTAPPTQRLKPGAPAKPAAPQRSTGAAADEPTRPSPTPPSRRRRGEPPSPAPRRKTPTRGAPASPSKWRQVGRQSRPGQRSPRDRRADQRRPLPSHEDQERDDTNPPTNEPVNRPSPRRDDRRSSSGRKEQRRSRPRRPPRRDAV